MIDFSQPFNFAQYLFDLNQGRGGKMAYIDDHGSLSYAQLQDQARRLAIAGPQAAPAQRQGLLARLFG